MRPRFIVTSVVALALVLQLYRAFRSVDTTETIELKG